MAGVDDSDAFSREKTVKLCNVSQFMREIIVEFFQNKDNGSGVSGSVERVYMCPDARDCVLVEFSDPVDDDIEDCKDEVEISGSVLKLEAYNSHELEHGPVSQIWSCDEQKPRFIEPTSYACDHMTDSHSTTSRDSDDIDLETKVKEEAGYVLSIKLHDSPQGEFSGPWRSVLRLFKRVYSWGMSSKEERGGPGDEVGARTISVDWLCMRYIMTQHYEEYSKLESVSREIRFGKPGLFDTHETDRSMVIIPFENDQKRFNEALADFIDFYQKMSEGMYREQPKEALLKDAYKDISRQFSVLLYSTGHGTYVYGLKANVKEAIRTLNGRGKEFVPSDPSLATRRPVSEPKKQKMVHELSKNVKLLVYQGDITDEDADAIVNPANEILKHGGGAALAIVEKGGEEIQAESNQLMKSRRNRPLLPGEVEVTSSGKLRCKLIIHAVGPRQSNYRDQNEVRWKLHHAVYNSLHNASRNGATSIAIPAISSGIFGVPVRDCATVLFSSVKDFAEREKDSKLREIRFVNIDSRTVNVFEKRMKELYGEAVKVVDGDRQESMPGAGGNKPEEPDEHEMCSICREKPTNPKTLEKCKHTFCTNCINEAFKHKAQCPNCGVVYGALVGNQPDGTMTHNTTARNLPGYPRCGTIVINYALSRGKQGPNHPNPGQPYHGANRTAYLPDNEKGRKVLGRLKKAFDQRLVFTIGRSVTSGADNCVTWNDIHHKTCTHGGPQNFGYPDHTYLDRVLEELAAKGITK